MQDRNKGATPIPAEDQDDRELIAVDLTGKDAALWGRFRGDLATRLKNLFEAVTSLDTFKRRSVGRELNRIAHALIESAHAALELPASKNEKTKAEVAAALAKAELDRANARVANAEADQKELETRQLRQRAANRELQRRIAKGELQVVEHNGQLLVIAVSSGDSEDDAGE